MPEDDGTKTVRVSDNTIFYFRFFSNVGTVKYKNDDAVQSLEHENYERKKSRAKKI